MSSMESQKYKQTYRYKHMIKFLNHDEDPKSNRRKRHM